MRKFLAALFLLLPSLALAQTHMPSTEAPGRVTFSFTPKELEVLNFAIGEQPCKIVCGLNLALSMQVMQAQQQAQQQAAKASSGQGRVFTPAERDVPSMPSKPEAKAPANTSPSSGPRTSPWPTPGAAPAENSDKH